MPPTRTARPGDHLTRIAQESGFRGYPPLWNDPANREVHDLRGTPHILAEGDAIVVPPPVLREVDRPVDQRHRFVADLPVLVLRVALEHWDRTTVALDDLTVTLDGREVEPESAADGVVEIRIDGRTDHCTLTLGDRSVAVRVGFLRPVSTLAGCRDRLTNLGYRPGDSSDPADPDLRSAIEEFQCDEGLDVDGIPGPGTQKALVKVHGC